MPNRYSAKALARASGVSVRTLHEWIRKKVLAPPLGRGRGAHYNETHVAAARVVRHMRELGVPLPVIRARISGRTVAELQALLPARLPVETRVESSPSSLNANAASPFSASQTLQVVALRDGLKLLLDTEHGDARRVAEEIYRQYSDGAGS
jgi:DNA-binding transcriptional MerR regulator